MALSNTSRLTGPKGSDGIRNVRESYTGLGRFQVEQEILSDNSIVYNVIMIGDKGEILFKDHRPSSQETAFELANKLNELTWLE